MQQERIKGRLNSLKQ